MINHTRNQQPKNPAHASYLTGIADGSKGFPLQIKFMHNCDYINGYILGLGQWATELEQQEQESQINAALEF